jgi:hypothetical protein
MAPIILFHAAFIGPILLLPRRWVWAWLNLLGLAFSALYLTTSPLLGKNSSASDLMVALLFMSVGTAICLALFGRLVFHVLREDNMAMRLDHPATHILHIANGAMIGGVIGLLGASLTEGTDAPIIHAVLVVLSVLPLAFLRHRGLTRLYLFGMALGCAALTFFSLNYPKSVLSSAQIAADDAPFCIYLNQSKRFANGAQDLTFFTFDKGNGDAHAVLIIGSGDATRYGNWSYYQNQFMVPWDLGELPTHLQCPTDH